MTDLHIQSKQLQTLLTQQIHALYKQQLNHQVGEITCKTFDNTIVIVMQGIATRPEQLLTEFNRQELAEEMRQVLDRIIQPNIKDIIEEVLSVRVIDFLCDTKVETGRAGAIAICEFQPQNDTRAQHNHN